MRFRNSTMKAANALLHRAGVHLASVNQERPWDRQFAQWIEHASRSSVDPNDVGDRSWGGEAINTASTHLFPHINGQSVVLELGPGTGRHTRHVLPRCGEMILADYSQLVCDWLAGYLAGKGRFRVCPISGPAIPCVADASVDFVFANGVFEHLDHDDTDFFLQDFYRLLKPGGRVWFNFDNFMSREGLEWFASHAPAPGERRIFRFYHPDFLRRMAEARGFKDVRMKTDDTRFGYLLARKAGNQAVPG